MIRYLEDEEILHKYDQMWFKGKWIDIPDELIGMKANELNVPARRRIEQ